MLQQTRRRARRAVIRGARISGRTLWFELDGAGSPRLVLVREPDQLGVERAHPQLAFGVRLIELREGVPTARKRPSAFHLSGRALAM
jgi:hypothetical protein